MVTSFYCRLLELTNVNIQTKPQYNQVSYTDKLKQNLSLEVPCRCYCPMAEGLVELYTLWSYMQYLFD